MRVTPISVLLVSLFVAMALLAPSRVAVAQSSCVFLPSIASQTAKNDRPIGRLRPLRRSSPSTPLSVQNGAPDFPNINVSHDFTQDQDETSIVVDPNDPSIVVMGANDYRSSDVLWSYNSTDGGLHWNNQAMPAHKIALPQSTDPSLGISANGIVYYAFGIYEPTAQPRSEVLCYHSSEGGKSWSAPAIVWADTSATPTKLADKYYLAVDNDPTSPRAGTVYVCWTEIGSGVTRIAEAKSTDGGVSWSPRVYVTPDARQYQSPIPAVLPDGKLVVTYIDLDSNRKQILAAVSDGGLSFAAPVKISDYNHLGPLVPPNDLEGHPTIKGLLDVNSFPAIAIDHSSRSKNRIYVTWAATDAAQKAHIYLSTSDNEGVSWSSPRSIENDASPKPTDKFFPWIAVDQSSGDVGVCFYDSRDDQDSNLLVNLYMAVSTDGGSTFTSRRISNASCDPRQGNNFSGTLFFFGDYTGLSVAKGFWYPAWTDTRSGYDQDVYTALVRPHAPAAVLSLTATETASHFASINWNYAGSTTFGWLLSTYKFRLRRDRGGLDTTLSSTATGLLDTTVLRGSDYSYTIQVQTNQNDTSTRRTVIFSPRGSHTPETPKLQNAVASDDGMELFFLIPSSNSIGGEIINLHTLYIYVDGNPYDSLTLTDGMRGTSWQRTLHHLSVGYHKIELAASAIGIGDTELSARSPAAYLYAGHPLAGYQSDWSIGPLFTLAHWDTTTAGGRFSHPVLNDSLPGVPYPSGTNSWALLPAFEVTSSSNTLELEDIGLIAPQDSGLIEVSSDDGLSFQTIGAVNQGSHPSKWKSDLASSDTAHEAFSLKYLTNSAAVIRFRLTTHTSNGDGWFISDVHTSSLLAVASEISNVEVVRSAYPNPVRLGLDSRIEIALREPSTLRATLVDVLGITREEIIPSAKIGSGKFELSVQPGTSGVFWLVLEISGLHGAERKAVKLVVLP